MSKPSLSRVVEGFILHISAAGRSPHTIRNYQTDLQRFCDWIHDVEVDQVRPRHIEEYMVYLKNDYRITNIGGTTPIPPRQLSQKTLHNIHGSLSVFWKWVTKEFQLPNPFNVAPIKYYPKPIAPLKENEVESLLSACRHTSKFSKNNKPYLSKRITHKRDKAIILMFLDTGIRVSELCGIRVKDYASDCGRIMVTGKGLKTRFVYLGKVSSHALWLYLLERYPSDKPIPDDHLFTDVRGIYSLTRKNVLNLIKRIGESAGVKDVYPHKFRHTFAVEFLRNGGNIFELQQLLGHSDLAMVKRYVHLAQVDLEKSAKKASPADRWRLR